MLEREQDATKYWKLSAGDWKEREYWNAYTRAYEDALNQCSTKQAPSFILPANKKWFRNLAVAEAVVNALKPFEKQWMKRLEEVGKSRRLKSKRFAANNKQRLSQIPQEQIRIVQKTPRQRNVFDFVIRRFADRVRIEAEDLRFGIRHQNRRMGSNDETASLFRPFPLPSKARRVAAEAKAVLRVRPAGTTHPARTAIEIASRNFRRASLRPKSLPYRSISACRCPKRSALCQSQRIACVFVFKLVGHFLQFRLIISQPFGEVEEIFRPQKEASMGFALPGKFQLLAQSARVVQAFVAGNVFTANGGKINSAAMDSISVDLPEPFSPTKNATGERNSISPKCCTSGSVNGNPDCFFADGFKPMDCK